MGDIIVLSVLAIICALAIRSLVKKKKRGSGCSCGCSACSMKDHCHPEEEKKTDK